MTSLVELMEQNCSSEALISEIDRRLTALESGKGELSDDEQSIEELDAKAYEHFIPAVPVKRREWTEYRIDRDYWLLWPDGEVEKATLTNDGFRFIGMTMDGRLITPVGFVAIMPVLSPDEPAPEGPEVKE